MRVDPCRIGQRASNTAKCCYERNVTARGINGINHIRTNVRNLELDRILVMSVNPGFGGQAFIESSLERLQTISAWRNDLRPSCEIGVDGGLHEATIRRAYDAGADVLIAGSAIFNDKASVAENVKNLRTTLQ